MHCLPVDDSRFVRTPNELLRNTLKAGTTQYRRSFGGFKSSGCFVTHITRPMPRYRIVAKRTGVCMCFAVTKHILSSKVRGLSRKSRPFTKRELHRTRPDRTHHITQHYSKLMATRTGAIRCSMNNIIVVGFCA